MSSRRHAVDEMITHLARAAHETITEPSGGSRAKAAWWRAIASQLVDLGYLTPTEDAAHRAELDRLRTRVAGLEAAASAYLAAEGGRDLHTVRAARGDLIALLDRKD